MLDSILQRERGFVKEGKKDKMIMSDSKRLKKIVNRWRVTDTVNRH